MSFLAHGMNFENSDLVYIYSCLVFSKEGAGVELSSVLLIEAPSIKPLCFYTITNEYRTI